MSQTTDLTKLVPNLETRVCPYPFGRMEAGRALFVPCCVDLMDSNYFNFFNYDKGPSWNGQAAKELRRLMLRGNLKLCNRKVCKTPLVSIGDLIANPRVTEVSIPRENLEAILAGKVEMPKGPTSLCIVADDRCNLACPSCRSATIFDLTESTRAKIEKTNATLLECRESLEIIKMAGDGEVFFSPWLRGLLKTFSQENYPALQEVHIQTNGLLFDARAMTALMPGTSLISNIAVSIDAADAQTYKLVRGGDWARLRKNLDWMAEQRRSKRFTYFKISFVVSLANFESIPAFIHLGEILNVDLVEFTAIMPWPRMDKRIYSEQAVHLPGHPDHIKLMSIVQKFRDRERVLFGIPILSG